MKTIVDHINKAVKERGTTQIHLVRTTGIPKARMSRFLTGQGGMYPTDLIKLMQALDFKIIAPDGNPVLFPLIAAEPIASTANNTTEQPADATT